MRVGTPDAIINAEFLEIFSEELLTFITMAPDKDFYGEIRVIIFELDKHLLDCSPCLLFGIDDPRIKQLWPWPSGLADCHWGGVGSSRS